ncbi:MAG: proline--tRNA ligase [Chloroflexi bacterium]|nr:proline--tRNA ligase [Chloroflexota bacterium]
MRLSKLFGKTLREVTAEAELPSHQLLLKAGMIYQVTAGVYSYLPLGWRALRKLEQIIREEMDAAGGQEVHLAVLQPFEWWQDSGRDLAFGQSLFTLFDRRERKLALGPTHEEMVTDMARRNVKSYRDLPMMVYQIQTKFRDEPRPRGGLVRVREFTMKDAYSFDADAAGLDISYKKVVQAYKNIYARCGLKAMLIEADSGAIGGKDSHEFMVATEIGEDEIIYCGKCACAANAERAGFVKEKLPDEKPLPLLEVATPGAKTIEEVANLLGIPKNRTIKAVFYSADGEPVFVIIRGDLDVNEVKLKNALKVSELRLANDEEVKAAGLVAGSASAIGLKGVKIVADDSITTGHNFVVGANRNGYHLKNANYPRDFKADIITDIAQAKAGYHCAQCGSRLLSERGIEIGHVFKLGTVFSEKQGALYIDRDGVQKPLVMGCYGIGVGRLLAAVIEQNHDDKGIIWPVSVAPYTVYLCALGMDDEAVASAAEKLYRELCASGIEVIYDDRNESPGVKFNDADLLGIPVRLTLSKRTLKSISAEVKLRRDKDAVLVPLSQIEVKLQTLLK